MARRPIVLGTAALAACTLPLPALGHGPNWQRKGVRAAFASVGDTGRLCRIGAMRYFAGGAQSIVSKTDRSFV